MEEDLPENYADLARRVYRMAEKEGWSQQKVFELLKDPHKLVKTMEHVSITNTSLGINNFVSLEEIRWL